MWKILEEMGIPEHLTCLLRNLYAGQEATIRTRHGTMGNWKHGKWRTEFIKAVCCHPANLTYMQNTSYKMPGWMNLKLESKLSGEVPTTSDMQMMIPL